MLVNLIVILKADLLQLADLKVFQLTVQLAVAACSRLGIQPFANRHILAGGDQGTGSGDNNWWRRQSRYRR